MAVRRKQRVRPQSPHDVFIIAVPTGPHTVEYRVRPSVWAGPRGSHFRIRNMTAQRWEIAFAPAVLTRRPAVPFALEPFDPTGRSRDDLDVTLSLVVPPGCYPYAVTQADGPFVVTARGESEPVMIIDP